MKSRSAGFTLVEMLVALFAFSLLTGAAVALIGFSLNSKDALSEVSGDIRDLQVARAIMKADFAQVVLRPVRGEFGEFSRFAFEGGVRPPGESLVAFVRRGRVNPMGAETRSSLQHVEYVLKDRNMVRRTRSRLDLASKTPIQSTPLIGNVDDVTVSFLSNGIWSGQWRAQKNGSISLPDAVAIEVNIAGIGNVRQVFLAQGR